MVKTIRISDDYHSVHRELLKIQGEIQAKTGELTTMEAVLAELVRVYRKRRK